MTTTASANMRLSSEDVIYSGEPIDFGNKDLRHWLYATYKCLNRGYEKSGEAWSFCVTMINSSNDGDDTHSFSPAQLHGLCLPPNRTWSQQAGVVLCVDCTTHGCQENKETTAALHTFCCGYFLLMGLLLYIAVQAYYHYNKKQPPQQPTEMAAIRGGNMPRGWEEWWLMLLAAFSPTANLSALLSGRMHRGVKSAGVTNASKSPATIDGGTTCTAPLTCLDGLRVIGAMWVVIGHMFMMAQAYVSNGEEMSISVADSVFNQWISNFTLSTDIFFTLSGCVCAYNFVSRAARTNLDGRNEGSEEEEKEEGNKKPEKRNKESLIAITYHSLISYDWLKRHYLHRLVRLWPSYAFSMSTTIVISTMLPAHHKQLLSGFDTGPACYHRFFQNLFFLNTVRYEPVCNPWMWQVGTDFIFYAVVAPIPLVLLAARRPQAHMLLAALVLVSGVLNVLGMVGEWNYAPTLMHIRQPPNFAPFYIEYFVWQYITPWYRVGSYAVGLALGAQLAYHDVDAAHQTAEGEYHVGGSQAQAKRKQQLAVAAKEEDDHASVLASLTDPVALAQLLRNEDEVHHHHDGYGQWVNTAPKHKSSEKGEGVIHLLVGAEDNHVGTLHRPRANSNDNTDDYKSSLLNTSSYHLNTNGARSISSPHPSTSSILSWLSASLQSRNRLLCAVVLVWSVAGHHPSIQGWDCHLYHVFHGSTFRPAFAAALGWLIYACHTGQPGWEWVNSALSHRYFTPLSPLTYHVYMMAAIPLMVSFFYQLHPVRYTGVVALLPLTLFQVVLCFGYGLIAHLLVEKPTVEMERMLLFATTTTTTPTVAEGGGGEAAVAEEWVGSIDKKQKGCSRWGKNEKRS